MAKQHSPSTLFTTTLQPTPAAHARSDIARAERRTLDALAIGYEMVGELLDVHLDDDAASYRRRLDNITRETRTLLMPEKPPSP